MRIDDSHHIRIVRRSAGKSFPIQHMISVGSMLSFGVEDSKKFSRIFGKVIGRYSPDAEYYQHMVPVFSSLGRRVLLGMGNCRSQLAELESWIGLADDFDHEKKQVLRKVLSKHEVCLKIIDGGISIDVTRNWEYIMSMKMLHEDLNHYSFTRYNQHTTAHENDILILVGNIFLFDDPSIFDELLTMTSTTPVK